MLSIMCPQVAAVEGTMWPQQAVTPEPPIPKTTNSTHMGSTPHADYVYTCMCAQYIAHMQKQ